MKENFKNRGQQPAGNSKPSRPYDAAEWSRLEEVGDLHFHSSAFSVALDYYLRLIDDTEMRAVPRDQALGLLRKTADCHLRLGQLDRTEAILDRAVDLISQTSTLLDPIESAELMATFDIRRAAVYRERGRLHDALNLAKRAFTVLALTDEHAAVARLQTIMGICQARLGRQEKAEEFFHDGLSTYRRIGHDLGVANLLSNLAVIEKNRCRWEKALSNMEKAVELAHRIGASHLLPRFYLNQGIILQKIDRLGESRSLLEKGMRLAVSLGDKIYETRLSLSMGRLEMLAGRLARSETLVLNGKSLAEEHSLIREATIADEYLGDILLMRGDFLKARFNYQLGLEKSRSIAAGNDLEGELQRRVGETFLMAEEFDRAVAVSQAAIAICEKCGEDYEIGFCHLTMGKAYGGREDWKQADHHFRQAIAKFQEQRLPHLWCRAILDFAEVRLENATEPELLLFRRYLMDAQDDGAASVSDQILCQILEKLAAVQILLGQFDDSLLTVFELERHAAGCDDGELDASIVQLRGKIEAGLLGGVQSAESHFAAISDLPGLFASGGPSISRNLNSVLAAGMERVKADSGFIAMFDSQGPVAVTASGLTIATRHGLTENLSAQLADWCAKESLSDRELSTSFFSRLDQSDEIIKAVPALLTVADSCLFMPIALHERKFGLLYLGKSGVSATGNAFDRSSLDFLATYMGFLALFLYEKNRNDEDGPEHTPFKRIESFENIITQNSSMLDVLGLARKVAPNDLTVLLNGETGTGKGLLAYSVHALSKRAKQRFMSINCAAIPESLLESELFGHKRGSFTGAHSDKKGLLSEAEGGTVFLDEIGKMPLSMQGKLLHFMDTKTVRPVGATNEFKVDVRVICASKSDLHQMAMEGRFLEDLYYRLLDFPLVIPPLRERPDDIELLSRHFVRRFSEELGAEIPGLDRKFLDCLVEYNWPGNVRELEKALRRAIVLAEGDDVLRVEHLAHEISKQENAVRTDEITPLKETLAAIECREITRAMVAAEGNKSQVARVLKISYPNLLKKIRHYGIA
ncbi:MAG: DNA-binding NtrC family response regulator/tetratricopeptide (TPR) repeat protein [Candidatus Krumholzibacteriia bacterium]|jgi:DNA-binding NtrC family response regulator/tetratricopeptide (TPR) repeat protein